ncbi:break repair meiotic recombinase recruitment factor 1 isoform X3 [Oryctolagus cuniculus]|uniref:break repair meiotic recombinase recruitment factor 1 isoform X3 n=1 Tax=Oryctolagus cuniculus TaxID=9986 RepID=UPI00387926FF
MRLKEGRWTPSRRSSCRACAGRGPALRGKEAELEQISHGRHKMTKRKKLRTSGGALCPPRAPKDPRLGESDGGSQSPTLRCWQHLEESESRSGPSSSPEHSQEQPGQAGPSSQDVDTGAACRLPGPPEKEPPLFPLSQHAQNAAGRFVPQFAKPRKTATLRKAESGDEAAGSSGTPSPEAPSPSEPSARQAELLQETQGLGHQTESDSACPGYSGRDPAASSKDTLPSASGGEGAWPCVSERASQDPGAHTEGDESSQETKRPWVPVSCGQEGPLLGSEAAGRGAEAGAPQEGGTQGGAGVELPQGPQEEEDATAGTPVSAPAVGPPWGPGPGNQGETASGPGSPGSSSPGAHVATEPPAPEQRALQAAGVDGQAAPSSAASPGGTAPDGGHSPAPLGHTPLAGDSPGGREQAGPEDTGDSPAGAPGNREPAVGAAGSGHAALQTSPDVAQRQGPGPQPPDLEGLCPSLGASALPGDRLAAADPAQERRAPQHQPEAAWEAASATELDFLPDSQIQGVLDFEAPPQQACPVGPCWPDPSPLANRGPITVARPQQRAPEAVSMEDATDTVRGLIVELSNLNRLIMGAHRDLDAFRRLQHRKTAAAGRGPGPYAPQYPWRGL